MAEAARVVEQRGFNIVDLNFDCPAQRLLARGEGGGCWPIRRPSAGIVAAVRRAVSILVTVKIRSGPDAQRETAAEVARQADRPARPPSEFMPKALHKATSARPIGR